MMDYSLRDEYVQPIKDYLLYWLAGRYFEHEAEDMVQEARIALYKYRADLASRRYAFIVAKGAMLDWLRRYQPYTKANSLSMDTGGAEGVPVDFGHTHDYTKSAAYKEFARGLNVKEIWLVNMLLSGYTLAELAAANQVDHEVMRRLRAKVGQKMMTELNLCFTGKPKIDISPEKREELRKLKNLRMIEYRKRKQIRVMKEYTT